MTEDERRRFTERDEALIGAIADAGLDDPDGDDPWIIAAYYDERDGRIINPPPDASWIASSRNVVPFERPARRRQ